MFNPIQIIQDWSKVKHVKEGLYDALMKRTPPGQGITIKDQGVDAQGKPKGGGPNDQIVARAIILLLKENQGKIEALDHGMTITLMRTLDARRGIGDSYDKFVSHGSVLKADNLSVFGIQNGAALPPHEFRDGVPDDYNGPVENEFDAHGGLVGSDGRPL